MTLTVIDIGCANHGTSSIDYLIERHQPTKLLGYDPHLRRSVHRYEHKGATVYLVRGAVLPAKARAFYKDQGSATTVNTDGDGHQTYDWSVSEVMDYHESVILKLDVEGAEYDLLEAILEHGLDERITLLYVEWHGDTDALKQRRNDLEARLRCPIKEWAL